MNLVGNINGAKLDDCHSTFFTLADLKGIKWHKFTSSHKGIIDDPIVIAYTKFLQSNILATWRHLPKKSDTPDLDNKELFVFWWGDEPFVEELLKKLHLECTDPGNWETGLSYHARCMLYKSILNQIERCLMIEGFVRINKWFTKPCSSSDNNSEQLSFKFEFFLHGEHTICTTLEVARHMKLFRLSYNLFNKIVNSQLLHYPFEVLLAPSGLKAQLTGLTCKQHEETSVKVIEEFSKFYPMHHHDESSDPRNFNYNETLSPVVQVLCAGRMMNYPSYLIMITEDVINKLNSSNKNDNNKDINESLVVPKLFSTLQEQMSAHGNFLLKKQVDRKCWKFVENMQEETLLNDCDYFSCADQLNIAVETLNQKMHLKSHHNLKEMHPFHKPVHHFSQDNEHSDDYKPNSIPPSVTSSIHTPITVESNIYSPSPSASDTNLEPPSVPESYLTPSSPYYHHQSSNCQAPYASAPLASVHSPFRRQEDDFIEWKQVGATKRRYHDSFDDNVACYIRKLDKWKKYHLFASKSNLMLHPLEAYENFMKSSKLETVDNSDYFLASKKPRRLKVENLPPIPNENLCDRKNVQSIFTSDTYQDEISDNSIKSWIHKSSTDNVDIAGQPQQSQLLDLLMDSIQQPNNLDVATTQEMFQQHPPKSQQPNSMDNQHNTMAGIGDFSMDDLDKVFEGSNEELPKHLQGVPTPPTDVNDVQGRNQPNYSANELPQHMYPTPPSIDAINQPSTPPEVTTNQVQCISSSKLTVIPLSSDSCKELSSNYLNLNSSLSRDESSVSTNAICIRGLKYTSQHKIYNTCKFPSSKIYAPINELPSHQTCDQSACLQYYPPTRIVQRPHSHSFSQASTPYQHCNYLGDIRPSPSTPRHQSITTPQSCHGNLQPSPLPPNTPKTPHITHMSPAHQSIISPTAMTTTLLSPSPLPTLTPVHHHMDTTASINMNLMLFDQIFNVVPDRSYDMCPLCTCAQNTMHFGGTEVNTDKPAVDWENSDNCVCGFSSSRNRMLSKQSGLFLEDQLDINCLKVEKEIVKNVETLQKNPIDIKEAAFFEELVSVALQLSCSPFSHPLFDEKFDESVFLKNTNVENDEHEACIKAFEVGLNQHELVTNENPMHRWSYQQCDLVHSSSQHMFIHQLLRSLKPTLQKAIQRKRSDRSYETTQHVKGPLTWREFCKDAGKEADSQPVPVLKVGVHKNSLMLISPSSLDMWDRLALEPYSSHHDLLYSCIASSNKISWQIHDFMKELSSRYQGCKLGKLKPMKHNGVNFCDSVKTDDIDDSEKILCEKVLNSTLDGIEVSNEEKINLRRIVILCFTSLLQQITTYVNQQMSGETENFHKEPQVVKSVFDMSITLESETIPHSGMVLFIIDQFHGKMTKHFITIFALLRQKLPRCFKNRLVLQIVPLNKVVHQPRSNKHYSSYLKQLAFDCYVQSQHNPPKLPPTTIRSMTGFGPAFDDSFTKPGKKGLISKRSHIFSPLYVLNHPRANQLAKLGQSASGRPKNDLVTDVLFVSYILSHDHRFLLASATDQNGEFVELNAINMTVSPRRLLSTRKKRLSVRGDVINKLWHWIVEVCSKSSSKIWRVVIGKIGRTSHGELKDWAKFLNKKSLLQQKRKDQSHKIASACFISTEPDGSTMIMPNVVQLNKFGRTQQNNISNQLKTPGDLSSTSICVVATSATAQPNLNSGTDEIADPLKLIDINGLNNDLEKEFDLNLDNIGSFINNDVGFDEFPGVDRSYSNDDDISTDTKLLEQPLAIGYMVSTAPPGPLPAWFFNNCNRGYCANKNPVFLRFALHIRTTLVDSSTLPYLQNEQHALDSNNTVVLLKYVLEMYTQLSWLTRQISTNDRKTCLPLHCLSLLQLYHLWAKITSKDT